MLEIVKKKTGESGRNKTGKIDIKVSTINKMSRLKESNRENLNQRLG